AAGHGGLRGGRDGGARRAGGGHRAHAAHHSTGARKRTADDVAVSVTKSLRSECGVPVGGLEPGVRVAGYGGPAQAHRAAASQGEPRPRGRGMTAEDFSNDVVVIGGCGHVGLPLGIALADRGLRTVLYDTADHSVKLVNDAVMPFDERGAQEVLDRVIADGRLRASTDPAVVGTARHVIVVIGTPVDEHLNPDPQAIPRALGLCAEYFTDGQIIVLRSTVYPGVTALVEKMVAKLGRDIDVAFCPERIAEGRAMTELYTLPQIVSSRTARGRARAEA